MAMSPTREFMPEQASSTRSWYCATNRVTPSRATGTSNSRRLSVAAWDTNSFSGAVMRSKRPAVASIGIDSDAAVISQWRDIVKNGDVAGEWWLPPGGTAICGDAISFLKNYQWQGGEFVYLDPPYPFGVRSSKREIYGQEFGTWEQHEELLAVIWVLPCMVAISGYWNELYADRLKDWRTISFNTVARSGEIRQEWLWMNYRQPQELHDYRFLGDDFRERERLTRMRRRWVARLARMEPLERLMLSAAISGEHGAKQAGNDDTVPHR